MEYIIKNLKYDKIKINWNKKPIPMQLFLSFLTIPVTRSYRHLGSENGWSKLTNEELELIISGGVVGGVEYLDSVQYGQKRGNGHNNYVNPFYLFDIMSSDGQAFFVDYYKEEIEEIVSKQKEVVHILAEKMLNAQTLLSELLLEKNNLFSIKKSKGE